MVKYSESRLGYKYVLTPKGLEDNRIRAKFEVNSACYKQYMHYVPTKWLEEKYVVEVKEELPCT